LDTYVPTGSHLCVFFAGWFQFSLLSAECWFLCMTLNLFLSLTNPFTGFKRNTRLFHLFSWGWGLFSAFLLMVIPNVAGYSDFDTCWTNALRTFSFNFSSSFEKDATCAYAETKTILLPLSQDQDGGTAVEANVLSWAFFYVWMMIFILAGLGVWMWANQRLSDGIRHFSLHIYIYIYIV
jgi:1-phosphatidylinositol-4-phosphate 5-kinase